MRSAVAPPGQVSNKPKHVQTVNDTPLGTKPEVAAQTIGGLPVSQNMKPTLDVACGPFVLEDGTFDIELI